MEQIIVAIIVIGAAAFVGRKWYLSAKNKNKGGDCCSEGTCASCPVPPDMRTPDAQKNNLKKRFSFNDDSSDSDGFSGDNGSESADD